MKSTLSPMWLLALSLLSSCASQHEGPLHPPPATVPVVAKPSAAAKPTGALRQVSATPVTPPKPKAFPDIPLKQDTGSSPLIHNQPDTPTYKRSGS